MIIDQLPSISLPVLGTDEMPVERGQYTYKAKVDDIVNSGSLPTIPRPNLLDNWYFVGGGSQQGGGQFPINQRGQLSYSGVSYAIDRWKQTGTYGMAVVSSDGLELQETGYGIAGLIFDQYGESENDLVGKTVTLSVLIKSLSSPYVFQCGGTTYTASEVGLHSFTVNSYAAQGYLVRIYNLTASGTATITAIKLELGATQTLAHQENGVWVLNEIPKFADELARCQRYFRKIKAWYTAFPGRTDSSNLHISFPFEMAKSPETLSNITAYLVGASNPSTTGTLTFYQEHGFLLRATIPIGTIQSNIGGTAMFSTDINVSADL